MRVSICVPVYNVEKYFEKCVRSLLGQTYEEIEYVFVDDCTPDKSIDILLSVSKHYPTRISNIKVIKHTKNEGVAISRNTTIDNATGDFIFFVDADDYIENDAIECFVRVQEHTMADIVTARRVVNEQEVDPRFVDPIYKDKDEMLLGMLSSVWHHELTNRLIRRSLFVDYNIKALPHVNICEDWQIVPQLIYYANSCVTIDKILYHYVINPNSITHSNTCWEKEKKGYFQEDLSLKVLINFFKGTKFESTINLLYCRRMAANIDLGIFNRDKSFFSWCRSNILLVKQDNSNCVSNVKMFCIKAGYTMSCMFLFGHILKEKAKLSIKRC